MILQNNNYDATNLKFGHKKIVFSHLVMGSIGPLLVKLLLGRLPKLMQMQFAYKKVLKFPKINTNGIRVQKGAKIYKICPYWG